MPCKEPPLTQDMLIARMHTQANIVLSKNMLSRIETDDRYITDIELAAFFSGAESRSTGLLGTGE